MTDEQGITLGVILQHMQGMERRITERFEGRFNGIDRRLGRLERKTDLMSVQIGNMYETLNAIDVENLPKRVTALEDILLRL